MGLGHVKTSVARRATRWRDPAGINILIREFEDSWEKKVGIGH